MGITMLNEYIPIAILLIVATGLAFLIVGIGHLFGPRRPTQRKMAPYESGMRPIGPGTRRMPVRFYLVAVLFIIFDIEVVFILPWAVVLKQFVGMNMGWYALAVMSIFILVLLVGFIYEWKMGAMEWE
jgi:NADH-quinone oxidoreductase subunit A